MGTESEGDSVRCRQREAEAITIYCGLDEIWYTLCHSIAWLELYVNIRTQSIRDLYNKTVGDRWYIFLLDTSTKRASSPLDMKRRRVSRLTFQ